MTNLFFYLNYQISVFYFILFTGVLVNFLIKDFRSFFDKKFKFFVFDKQNSLVYYNKLYFINGFLKRIEILDNMFFFCYVRAVRFFGFDWRFFFVNILRNKIHLQPRFRHITWQKGKGRRLQHQFFFQVIRFRIRDFLRNFFLEVFDSNYLYRILLIVRRFLSRRIKRSRTKCFSKIMGLGLLLPFHKLRVLGNFFELLKFKVLLRNQYWLKSLEWLGRQFGLNLNGFNFYFAYWRMQIFRTCYTKLSKFLLKRDRRIKLALKSWHIYYRKKLIHLQLFFKTVMTKIGSSIFLQRVPITLLRGNVPLKAWLEFWVAFLSMKYRLMNFVEMRYPDIYYLKRYGKYSKYPVFKNFEKTDLGTIIRQVTTETSENKTVSKSFTYLKKR